MTFGHCNRLGTLYMCYIRHTDNETVYSAAAEINLLIDIVKRIYLGQLCYTTVMFS